MSQKTPKKKNRPRKQSKKENFKQNSQDNEMIDNGTTSIESSTSTLLSRIQKLEAHVISIQKKIKSLENAKVPTTLKDLEINSSDAWEQVERSLYKTGLILEFGVAEKLNRISKSTGIIYDPSYSFTYPNVPGSFYIDLLCKEWIHLSEEKAETLNAAKDILTAAWNGDQYSPQINTGESERDFLVKDHFQMDVGRFRVNFVIKYAIECKSRIDPPVNYLIVTEDNLHLPLLPIQMSGPFWFLIDTPQFPETLRPPIAISPPHWNVEQDPRRKEAFWELFRCIDYESSTDATMLLLFHHPKLLQETKLNLTHEKDDFNKFLEIYDEIKKNGEIPKPLEIPIFIYIPIIVVNGIIYETPFISGDQRSLFDRKKKIPGFSSRMSHETLGETYKRSYFHIWNLVASQLRQIGIYEKDKSDDNKRLINIGEPEMRVLTLSEESFEESFKQLIIEVRKQVKKTCLETQNKSKDKDNEGIQKEEVFIWYVRNQKLGGKIFIDSLVQYLRLRSKLPSNAQILD